MNLDEKEQILSQMEACRAELRRLAELLNRKERVRTVPSPEVLEAVRRMNPIDDPFFVKMVEDPDTVEEIISTILQTKVKVLSVVPQNTVMNLQGRSVRLDALASVEAAAQVEAELLQSSSIGPKGAKVNIEVQRANNDDHERRVWYNTSAVLLNSTPAGVEKFADLPDVVSIFISTFDVIGNGRMMERIRRVDENGREHHNGLTEIYVNTVIRDTSTPEMADIAQLMRMFIESDAYDYERFPHFSSRKGQFKNTVEGESNMAEEFQEIMEKYAKEINRDLQQQIDNGILNMLELGMDVALIAKIQSVTEDYVIALRDQKSAA